MFHNSPPLDLGHKGKWGVLVWVGIPHTGISVLGKGVILQGASLIKSLFIYIQK